MLGREPEVLCGGGVPLIRWRALDGQTDVTESQLPHGLFQVALLTQSLIFGEGRVNVDCSVAAVVHSTQQAVRRLGGQRGGAFRVHYDGAVMRPFAWWEVLPHHCATGNAAAGRSTSTDADAGAAAVTAALCACVECSGHPLLVSDSQRAVHLRLSGKSS